jgi:hypothetical protein
LPSLVLPLLGYPSASPQTANISAEPRQSAERVHLLVCHF